MFGKKSLFAVLVIVVLLVGAVFVGFGFDWSGGGRDVSWVDDVEDFIVEVRPSEPFEYWDMGIFGYYFSLHDNNETELLYHVSDQHNSNDSLVLFLEDLLSRANNVVYSSVDEEFAQEIIQNNRFLKLFAQDFGANSGYDLGSYSTTRFILQDNLNKNLKGTIMIIQENSTEAAEENNNGKKITILEITK